MPPVDNGVPRRRNGCSRPYSRAQIAIWIAMLVSVIHFFWFLSPILTPFSASIVVSMLFALSVLCTLYFGLVTVIINPLDPLLAHELYYGIHSHSVHDDNGNDNNNDHDIVPDEENGENGNQQQQQHHHHHHHHVENGHSNNHSTKNNKRKTKNKTNRAPSNNNQNGNHHHSDYPYGSAALLAAGRIYQWYNPPPPTAAAATAATTTTTNAVGDAQVSNNNTIPTKQCWICDLQVYETSMHCKYCNKCVDKFDHHCVWLNTCIGRTNAPYFFYTVISILTMQVIHFIIGLCVFIQSFIHADTKNRLHDWMNNNGKANEFIQAIILFFVLFNFGAILLIGQLLVFHMNLRREKITTYQYIVRDHQRRRDHGRIQSEIDARRITAITDAARGVSDTTPSCCCLVQRLRLGRYCRMMGCEICDPLSIPSSVYDDVPSPSNTITRSHHNYVTPAALVIGNDIDNDDHDENDIDNLHDSDDVETDDIEEIRHATENTAISQVSTRSNSSDFENVPNGNHAKIANNTTDDTVSVATQPVVTPSYETTTETDTSDNR
jgi:hypothetical protein